MSPEEVIGKFVSFELMIKGSKQIVNLEQGSTSTPEVQPVTFKATKEKKEESTSSRLPIDASKLDNEEIALIIKSFRQILKQRRGKDYKPSSKRVCYKCGKPGHFIAVGAKAKTLPFALAFAYLAAPMEAERSARSTLRLLHYKTKAYDDVAPSHVLTRPGGPRGIQPIVIGPTRRSVLRARFVMTFL
jgi:hypothetical protein